MMHPSTRKKFNFLTRYVQRQFEKWKRDYPNIVGAHIGKKYTNGKFRNRYSIVFLVEQKLREPATPVPGYFTIRFPDKKKRKVPSDVYAIGKFSFRSIALGDRNFRKGLNEGGTIGALFQKGQFTYACTNMHVLLPDFIEAGQLSFFRPFSQQTKTDVVIFNDLNQNFEGFLEIALFQSIDAALVRIDPSQAESLLRGVGFPTGLFPVGSLHVGMELEMDGPIAGVQRGTVLGMGVSIDAPPKNSGNKLDNLIITSIFSLPGDSGSPVYVPNLRLVGIVIGGTPDTTFVLPLQAIETKLKYSIKI